MAARASSGPVSDDLGDEDLRTLHEWDEEFRKPAILEQHGEFTEVATIVDAGVYATLGEEVW